MGFLCPSHTQGVQLALKVVCDEKDESVSRGRVMVPEAEEGEGFRLEEDFD